MRHSIEDIAEAIGAKAVGDTSMKVDGIAEPKEAGPTELALAMSRRFSDQLRAGRAGAAMLSDGEDWRSFGIRAAILVKRSRYSLALASAMFPPDPEVEEGIHESAVLEPGSSVGTRAAVGPFVSIGNGAVVGDRCVIGAGASIGRNARIGDDAVIGPGVRIGHDTVIGDRFIAQPNAVIGSDGFAYATEDDGAVEEVRSTLSGSISAEQSRQVRINSLGRVVIGDDVEVGAGTAIDRGTISATMIGDRTKLDNNVHIAHNVVIGEDCLICGLVGIAGSARIGDRVVLGGMSGVKDHVQVGNDVLAAGAAKLFTNVAPKTAVMGSPAVPMDKNIEIYKNLRRLPLFARQLRELKKQVSRLAGIE